MSLESYYYFYDLNEILIDRYPVQIASNISSLKATDKFVFIYSEQYENPEPLKTPPGSKIFYIKDLSRNKLDEIIEKYPPNSLTTIAQRIPDMWMLSYFNHLGYPTFLVQHGLWSDRLERLPLIPLLLGKFSKFVNYLKHVNSLCKLNDIPLIPTLFDLYHFLLKENINIPNTKYLHNNMLRANKAFIFDESWNDYYIIKYGYNINNLIYIGNPDLLLLKNKDLKHKEDAVCYLCQSIAEDGRFGLTEYRFFLSTLNAVVAKEKKLYIKLHQRSKLDFYSVFDDNKNVILTHDLPICRYYIGHYTSLLGTVKQISDDILIWKLPNHHMPEYFFQFASIVTSDQEDLRKFVNGEVNQKNVQYFNRLSEQELNSFNPIKKIAETIISSIY